MNRIKKTFILLLLLTTSLLLFNADSSYFKAANTDAKFGDTTNLTYKQITSFSELPVLAYNFENLSTQTAQAQVLDNGNDKFRVEVLHQGIVYYAIVDHVPEFIENSKDVRYLTDKGSRFFIGFYESDAGWTETPSFDENIIENSWIFWNLETGEYTRSETNRIYAKVYTLGAVKALPYSNHAYADIVIPHEIDDLLAVQVTYKYQHIYLLGPNGKKTTVHKLLLEKEGRTSVDVAWYMSFFNVMNHVYSAKWWPFPFTKEQITEIDLTTSYKAEYVEDFNNKGVSVTEQELFKPGHKAYSLFLGDHNKLWSVGLNVTDLGILAYRYVYKGVEYSNPYPEVEAIYFEDKHPGDSVLEWIKNLFNNIWKWFVSYIWIGIPILALATFPPILAGFSAVFGNKLKKRRVLLFSIYTAILFIIWFAIK